MSDSRSFVEMLCAELPPLDPSQEEALYALETELPAAMLAWAVLQATLAGDSAVVELQDDVVDLATRFSVHSNATTLLLDWYTVMCQRRGMAAPDGALIATEVERTVRTLSTAEGFKLMARELVRRERHCDSVATSQTPVRVAMQISTAMEEELR